MQENVLAIHGPFFKKETSRDAGSLWAVVSFRGAGSLWAVVGCRVPMSCSCMQGCIRQQREGGSEEVIYLFLYIFVLLGKAVCRAPGLPVSLPASSHDCYFPQKDWAAPCTMLCSERYQTDESWTMLHLTGVIPHWDWAWPCWAEANALCWLVGFAPCGFDQACIFWNLSSNHFLFGG